MEITDTWNLKPGIELNPILINELTSETLVFNAEKQSNEKYIFKNIPPGQYQILLKYKSFSVEKSIKIDDDKVDLQTLC